MDDSDDAEVVNVTLTVQQIWEIVSSLDYIRDEWGPTLPPDPLTERLRSIAEENDPETS